MIAQTIGKGVVVMGGKKLVESMVCKGTYTEWEKPGNKYRIEGGKLVAGHLKWNMERREWDFVDGEVKEDTMVRGGMALRRSRVCSDVWVETGGMCRMFKDEGGILVEGELEWNEPVQKWIFKEKDMKKKGGRGQELGTERWDGMLPYDQAWGDMYEQDWERSWRDYESGRYTSGVKPVGTVKVKAKEVRVKIPMPGGMVWELREDGKLYREMKVWGMEFYVPVTTEEYNLEMLGAVKKEDVEVGKVEVKMKGEIEEKFMVPTGVMEKWANRLLKWDTEVTAYYGRTKDGVWWAVVPEQEVTGGSVDVKDSVKAVERLRELGCPRSGMGTVHTHPGGMSTFSGTDEKETLAGFGGVHWIVPRTREAGIHVALNGVTWDTGKRVKLGEGEDVEGEAIGLVGEDGTQDIGKFIKKKVYGVQTGTGGVETWWEKSQREKREAMTSWEKELAGKNWNDPSQKKKKEGGVAEEWYEEGTLVGLLRWMGRRACDRGVWGAGMKKGEGKELREVLREQIVKVRVAVRLLGEVGNELEVIGLGVDPSCDGSTAMDDVLRTVDEAMELLEDEKWISDETVRYKLYTSSDDKDEMVDKVDGI